MSDIHLLRHLVARLEGKSFGPRNALQAISFRAPLKELNNPQSKEDKKLLPTDSVNRRNHQEQSISPRECDVTSALFHFGVPKIDAIIGALPSAALHEFISAPQSLTAACGFATGFLNRVMATKRPLIWIEDKATAYEYGALYPSTFSFFGFDVRHFLVINCSCTVDALRAANDSLQSKTAGAIVLCLSAPSQQLDFTATRRLHLAAQKAATPILLIVSHNHLKTSSAVTRWKVSSAPSLSPAARAPGYPSFDVELMRNRFGGLGHWQLEWNPNEQKFYESTTFAKALHRSVFSPLNDRPFKKINA